MCLVVYKMSYEPLNQSSSDNKSKLEQKGQEKGIGIKEMGLEKEKKSCMIAKIKRKG